jgi:hypothetical protein
MLTTQLKAGELHLRLGSKPYLVIDVPQGLNRTVPGRQKSPARKRGEVEGFRGLDAATPERPLAVSMVKPSVIRIMSSPPLEDDLVVSNTGPALILLWMRPRRSFGRAGMNGRRGRGWRRWRKIAQEVTGVAAPSVRRAFRRPASLQICFDSIPARTV